MPNDALSALDSIAAVPGVVDPQVKLDATTPPATNDNPAPPGAPDEAQPTGGELKVGGLDERGNTVKYIYARDPDYIVYYSRLEHSSDRADDGGEGRAVGGRSWPRRAGRWSAIQGPDPAYESEGVQAQLSSAQAKRQLQRAKLLPLGTERAKLQALLRGWPRRQSYDSSIATALQLALDGNNDGASAKNAIETITDARVAILGERETAGRAQYVRFALAFGVLGLLLLWIAQTLVHRGESVWLGTEAGLFGAILSIAIGLRTRTVALDIGLAGNLSDSVLRLITGAVSGGTLVLLFSTGIVPPLHTLHGDLDVARSASFALLLGIIGGFVEQLVPSLLDKQADRLTDGDGGGKSPSADGGSKPGDGGAKKP